MGVISLPKGFTSSDYQGWLTGSADGRKASQTMAANTGRGMTTSYSPSAQSMQAWKSGSAQPQQDSFATSTPYQKNPAGDFAAYSPSSNTTRTQTYRQGSSPFAQAPQMPSGQPDGNWANYASPQRPSPFQATYGSPMGGQYEQPNFAQRDAFIQNINNQMAPYMTGQASGPPQFNFNQAWSNAGQMVNDGWQNPFTAVSQQSFPSQYQAPASPPVLRAAPPSTPSGIRARGPGDPPEVSPGQAQPSRYQQELERMKAQGSMSTMTAGRANSANEQALADALNRSPSVQSDLARSREYMQRPRPTQAPARFQPNASQMVAGMVQSTGATGYGAGSGQGGPNPGAIGYTQQRFQLPRTLGRKRGLGTSSGRSPIYI
jgi:hypothetical protein